MPDNKLYVIDLTTDPPRLDRHGRGRQAAVGPVDQSRRQPGARRQPRRQLDQRAVDRGQDRSSWSTRCRSANRSPHVVFTPDGKRALAAKFPGQQGGAARRRRPEGDLRQADLPVGLWPYNVGVTPDGKLALTADNGNSGRSDGNVDTVSVIDLEANPPRVIDKIVVDECAGRAGREPDRANVAAAILLGGSDGPKNQWFYHRNGKVAVLKVDGKKVTKTGEVDGRGHSRRRGLQSRRSMALRRQLCRQEHFGAARRRRQDQRHREERFPSGQPGLDAGTRAIRICVEAQQATVRRALAPDARKRFPRTNSLSEGV